MQAYKYQCSIIAGTIFENTKLPLFKWFLAAYLILTTKKGTTGPDLARKLDVGQDIAWSLKEKILRSKPGQNPLTLRRDRGG